MKQYYKFINDTYIEEAPLNKGSIINYYNSEERLIEDGFKPLEKDESNYNNYYLKYIEYDDKIVEQKIEIKSKEIKKSPEEIFQETIKNPVKFKHTGFYYRPSSVPSLRILIGGLADDEITTYKIFDANNENPIDMNRRQLIMLKKFLEEFYEKAYFEKMQS